MKLLLIDDQALFRDGCASLIRQTWPRLEVHHAASLRQAHEVLNRHPDMCVVLLGLDLPDGAGAANLERLMTTAEAPAYVVLPEQPDPGVVEAAFRIGATAAIPKTARSQELIEVLATVLDHRCELRAAQPTANAGALMPALSPRQHAVLRLLIEGRTNKEICRAMGLSASTVKTHVAAIFRKLGVTSRTQAAVAAGRLLPMR